MFIRCKSHIKNKMKNKSGFSVIELLVVLAILVIVITLGFELLSFGRNTFERGEKRYIVQENVRLASELITRELRYANEVVILPEVPLSFNEDRKYIFISDGILKHYKGNGNLTDALGGINSDAEFTTLEFSKSVASDSVLSFVIGAKSGTTPYASVSDVQILNFPEGKSIDDTSLIDLSLESGSVICYSHADNEKRLLEFGFKKVYNPSLSSSYIAYVDEYEYNVNIYIFGEIDLSGLIPHFEYIGKSITLDGIPQYPNDQPVDFNTPQTYTITAQDGSTVDYLITVTKASMPPSASGVKIIIINEAGDNEDEYNAAYEDSLLVGDYHYIPNGCGDEGASGFIWQWSESEDFSSPTTFAYTKEITPMGKAGSYVRFGVKPVSASGISAETFYFSPPEQIKPIVRNAFWKKFIDDIDTENRPEKPEGFVSSVYRRLDYIVESIMSPNTEDLNLTISNGADAYNPLVANGGTHISKDIAGYVADTNSYSITVDAQVRGGSGYGVLINGSVNKNNNNRDSGYMFQFDPGAGGFLVRKIENGDHDPTKAHGLKESVYRPSDIRNNEFRWTGDDYQGNPEWNKRYLTEIVVQIQNDGSLIFKATIIDEQGNRSNEMWFGDFGSYTMDIYDASGRRTTTKTFNGQKMGTDSHWSGGSMLGLRTWNRSEGSFDTLFQEIILGSGFGMDIESAEFLSTEKIMIKFSKPLNTLDMPFYLKDASAGRISFDGRSIDSASINDSNGESLEISLRSPYASAYQVKNGAEKKLSISKGGVKQIYAGEVAIPNGNNYDVNRDTTPPILLSKSVSSGRNLVLNFSEEMDHAQITERSNYSVIKSGKIITPVSITTGNNYKTVTVRFNENINIYTDTLILNNLNDVAGNPYEQDTEAPTAPTGLTSTDKGRNYVDLIWNASSDNVSVTGYQVYVNGDHNMTVTDTSCRVSSLNRNTNYRFTVRAVDAAENVSEPSNEISVRTNRN